MTRRNIREKKNLGGSPGAGARTGPAVPAYQHRDIRSRRVLYTVLYVYVYRNTCVYINSFLHLITNKYVHVYIQI